MRELTWQERMLAEECAARHRTPKATVTHPPGVIIQGDELLTENIKDPDYVPYCGPCVPFQRMRRCEDGFFCPTCLNKTNWDLTKFNGNVDVQFEEGFEAPPPPEPVVPKPIVIDWEEDRKKKNTSIHPCNGCGAAFFGKRRRKYCVPCEKKEYPVPEADTLYEESKPTSYSDGSRGWTRHVPGARK